MKPNTKKLEFKKCCWKSLKQSGPKWTLKLTNQCFFAGTKPCTKKLLDLKFKLRMTGIPEAKERKDSDESEGKINQSSESGRLFKNSFGMLPIWKESSWTVVGFHCGWLLCCCKEYWYYQVVLPQIVKSTGIFYYVAQE